MPNLFRQIQPHNSDTLNVICVLVLFLNAALGITIHLKCPSKIFGIRIRKMYKPINKRYIVNAVRC